MAKILFFQVTSHNFYRLIDFLPSSSYNYNIELSSQLLHNNYTMLNIYSSSTTPTILQRSFKERCRDRKKRTTEDFRGKTEFFLNTFN